MSRITWPVSSTTDSTPSVSVAGAAGAPSAWQATPSGFVVAGVWADVYRLAYQRAQAALEPSRFQKMLEPCWN